MSILQQAPRLDAGTAIELVRDLYGIEASISPLPSERDQNFLLATSSGDRFVLKIANGAEPRELLEAQNAAMQRAAALGLCPRVCKTRDDRLIARAVSGHFVRLLSWIPGRLLADLSTRSIALLEDLGRKLGSLTAALGDFDHPAIHRDFHWDLARGFTVVDEHVPSIDDPSLRALIRRTSGHVRARDGRLLVRLRRSAVHGDANDYNVVVDGDVERVSGLIDFGDIVHSWTVAEPAIAIADAVRDRQEPLAAASAILRGYHAAFPLTDDEVSVLFGLVQLRLCVSVCLAAHQRRLRPGDDYLLVSQAPIRRTLPALAAVHPDVAEEAFREACAMPVARGSQSPTGVTLAERRRRLGSNLSIAYGNPVKVCRGWMQYLFDEEGRQYLDAYNNVPHAGHSHPRILRAVSDQMRAVNTNTRYLHDTIWRFAERLGATLPAPLDVCYFVNSGSEANELALRLARAHTGARDVVVLEHAYHGNTTSLVEMSPYKFAGPGGAGPPDWVHVAPIPDDYRGLHRRGEADAGRRFGELAGAVVEAVAARGRGLAGFICESCPSVGGQIVPPAHYLETVYRHVRTAGGVCIADEVQTAYGRMGDRFYAFEAQNVVPDIVVLGKPIGNGYPLGAVVTTRAIAASFDNGMEFFSTFGGSTASCAAGLATLETVLDEDLQSHADRVGRRLLSGLAELSKRHEVIGDVRGRGLFLGVELVSDRASLAPATGEASRAVNAMRDRGVLIGTEGPSHNILKIRPPMPFDDGDADRLLDVLDGVLTR